MIVMRSPKLRELQSILIGCLLAASNCSYAAGAPDPADTNVIARVGDTEVKLDDIRSAIESLDARDQAALAKDPSLLNQTVRTLLTRRLVAGRSGARRFDRVVIVGALAKQNGISRGAYLQWQALRDLGVEAELLDLTPALRNPLIHSAILHPT